MSRTLRDLIMEGLRKFAKAGYQDEFQLSDWLGRLHAALDLELPDDDESRVALSKTLHAIFDRDVRNGIARRIPDIEPYTIDRVMPHMRAELDKRIYAGADLIKLNREAAIRKTLQRFSGWVSSVPPQGTSTNDLRDIANEMLKPIKQVKFEARRVAIDQGHKLSAAVAHVVAQQNGAIAGIWHDRGENDHGYDARPKHLARSKTIFLIRNSWAMDQGLIRRGVAQYTDDIEQPAELPYCSCFYEYITTPHDLPDEYLTTAGKVWTGRRESRFDSVPSDRQIKSGNYRKGHMRLHGLNISIENPAGSIRRGFDHNGHPWSVTVPCDYGYIRGTIGADGDHLDCHVGPNPASTAVWIVFQENPDTHAFDEHKVMLGFDTRIDALQTYERAYHDGRGQYRMQDVLEMNVDEFKGWMRTAGVA